MTKKPVAILWILVLATLLRLVHLDARPVGRHAWRQCDTAGIARNFHEHGYFLLYPQVDWEVPGYVEMEFPLYPWTVAVAYGLTTESEALARLLSALASVLTVFLIYLTVRRILGRRAALWAAFFYAVLPLSLFFGRAIMPESWMLAATAAAVYFFLRWTEEDSWPLFFLAAATTALACLLKLTSLYLGVPLLWLAWRRFGRQTLRQGRLWLFGLLVLAPVVAWYAHAYGLGQRYGASFNILTAAGADKWGRWELLWTPDFYQEVFLTTPGERLFTWVGLAVFLVGVCLPRRSRDEHLFDLWLLAVVFMLLLANGGAYAHDYYSLPLLLPGVAFMGKAFDHGWERRRNLLLAAVALISALSGYRYGRWLSEENLSDTAARPLPEDVAIARQLADRTSPGDLVISCNAADPVWLYLARRRGWGRDCSVLSKDELEELAGAGARYLVVRPADLEADGGKRLGTYLRTFYPPAEAAGPALLTDIRAVSSVGEVGWQQIFAADLDGTELPERWRFDSGHWRMSESALLGSRSRKAASALAMPAFAGCSLCRVRVTLGVVRPVAKRLKPRVSLKAWWAAEGTEVTVTLGTTEDKVWFQQREDGKLLKSVLIPHRLENGRDYDIEVRFDLFDFELVLDGESLLTSPSRFSSMPLGTVGVQARAAEVRLSSLRVLSPQGPIDANLQP